jgi:hypothetical protein
MKIIFNDSSVIPIELYDSIVEPDVIKIYKHLQNITIPFQKWDSPFYSKNYSYADIVDFLAQCGELIGVKVDKKQCLSNTQQYFNLLHKIYEVGYNGLSAWLDFHEHIHICENFHNQTGQLKLSIDYREKAGMLEKPFDFLWIQSAVTELKPGDVYISWAELGKSPYTYWQNNEPNDIQRICQLAKPWLTFRPKLNIALVDINSLYQKDIVNFNNWWKTYHEEWCLHWGIPQWTIENMFSHLVIGNVNDINNLTCLLKNNVFPEKVTL